MAKKVCIYKSATACGYIEKGLTPCAACAFDKAGEPPKEGPPGPPGPKGDSVKGDEGEKGASIQGGKGEKGDTIIGPTGLTGPPGRDGRDGVGTKGPKGDTGATPKIDKEAWLKELEERLRQYAQPQLLLGWGARAKHENLPDVTSGQHHAKYLDSEAIAAVEGEATLDLEGDVAIAAGKSLAVDAIVEKTGAAGVALDDCLALDDDFYLGKARQATDVKLGNSSGIFNVTRGDGSAGGITTGYFVTSGYNESTYFRFPVTEPSEKTLSGDAFTQTSNFHKLQPQSGTSDDLANIIPVEALRACFLFLKVSDDADTITIKHEAGGYYDISCVGGQDIVLSGNQDIAILILDFTTFQWYCLARYSDAEAAAVVAATAPKAHKVSHQNGGADEVATATPGANDIPKAGAGGKLAAGWVQEILAYADLTDDPYADHSARHENTGADEISVAGLSGELADDQPPKAHASTHQNGGGDEVATATPGANAIPKAGAGGKLAAGWVQEVLAYADLTDDPLAAHVAAGDPHAGYQQESEKAAANGYMGLDANQYGTDPPQAHPHLAAGSGGALYSVHQYVFCPDAGPGVDVETGAHQGPIHVSGPSTETVKRITAIGETAAGTAFTFTLDYDSGNDDFDTFAVDTEIDEVAMGTAKGVVVSAGFTTPTITARSLISLDVATVTGSAPKDVTIILEVWRPLQT